MDALDIVNSNLAEATESWAVCRKEIETVQHTVQDQDDISRTASGDSSADVSVHETSDVAVLASLQQCPQHTVNVTSRSQCSEPDSAEYVQTDTLSASRADEIRCPTAEVGELVDKSDKSSSKSSGSSVKNARNKSAATRLFTDTKHRPSTVVESKKLVGPQKNVVSKTPQKTETVTSSAKVGPSSNISSRTPSLTSRRSVDLSGSSPCTPLSSHACSKPADLTTRRPSVPRRTAKQPTTTGGSKQQNLPQRKSSTTSEQSHSSLSDQKTTSESSLAAGDFTGDLPAAASLRSSTPLTSSLGDCNDPSSISRVCSMSDASSPSASHGSSSAFSASVFQSPKPSTSTGRPQLLFGVFLAVFMWII